jgi:hypothetical protein
LENHQVELSQPDIAYAQGQSFYFCCVDRGAEPGAGDEGDASVHPGLDGTPHWMVHCCQSYTLSFFPEASFHQPFSSVRFYLINDGAAGQQGSKAAGDDRWVRSSSVVPLLPCCLSALLPGRNVNIPLRY